MLSKLLLSAAIAAGLTAATLGTWGCSPKPPPQTPAPSPAPTVSTAAPPSGSALPSQAASPAAQTQPITAISRGTGNQPARYIVRNPQGKIIYDVRSIKVVYNRATDGTSEATFTKPDVIFHDKTGHTMIAQAPQAVAHDKDKSVTMSGGVHAKTDDGKILTCDTLTYDAKNEQIHGAGNVVLTDTKTNQAASGQSLQSDLSFEHLTLSGSP